MQESLSNSPAAKAILDKLAELLFTYALRQYLVDYPDKVGVLAIYGNTRLAKALEAIHKHPEKAWTLESMAHEAMLSRTVFSETFLHKTIDRSCPVSDPYNGGEKYWDEGKL